jgi:hypothetical protein
MGLWLCLYDLSQYLEISLSKKGEPIPWFGFDEVRICSKQSFKKYTYVFNTSDKVDREVIWAHNAVI